MYEKAYKNLQHQAFQSRLHYKDQGKMNQEAELFFQFEYICVEKCKKALEKQKTNIAAIRVEEKFL